ncbi:MAG: immunoglobulin domain-containing protein, partial [Limisphaerales bacterium]
MAASKIHGKTLAGLKNFQLRWILTFVTILSGIFQAFAAHTVNLAWDASTDSTVVGYKVYYGTSQATLASSSSVDVGANLSASIVNLGTGTYYFAATSYDVNRAESDLSNVTSTNFLDAPAIVAQSGNVSCTYGSTTNLKVTANGAAPLSYQWYSNSVAMVDGGNVTGSTTASITFNSAVDANQGNYQVVVANSIGTATSALMTLTVFDPPVIASQ